MKKCNVLQPFALKNEKWYNMGVFDDLIKIYENGIVSYAGWAEWKHVPMGYCIVLYV